MENVKSQVSYIQIEAREQIYFIICSVLDIKRVAGVSFRGCALIFKNFTRIEPFNNDNRLGFGFRGRIFFMLELFKPSWHYSPPPQLVTPVKKNKRCKPTDVLKLKINTRIIFLVMIRTKDFMPNKTLKYACAYAFKNHHICS